MRLVLQRVREAHVEVEGVTHGRIGKGLVVFVGIERNDTKAEAEYLVSKMMGLRIFNDERGRMNRSVFEIGGELLIVSQFTLYGDCKKGMRPSFDRAAPAEEARYLYDYFVGETKKKNTSVQTGVFQASMSVHLVNDGPVTLICESPAMAK